MDEQCLPLVVIEQQAASCHLSELEGIKLAVRRHLPSGRVRQRKIFSSCTVKIQHPK